MTPLVLGAYITLAVAIIAAVAAVVIAVAALRQMRSHETEDAGMEFARLLRERDRAQLGRFFRRYHRVIATSLQRRFGTYLTSQDMDEIIRRTWMHALRSADRYEPTMTQPERWLNVLAHAEALRMLRRRLDDPTFSALVRGINTQLNELAAGNLESPTDAFAEAERRVAIGV